MRETNQNITKQEFRQINKITQNSKRENNEIQRDTMQSWLYLNIHLLQLHFACTTHFLW